MRSEINNDPLSNSSEGYSEHRQEEITLPADYIYI